MVSRAISFKVKNKPHGQNCKLKESIKLMNETYFTILQTENPNMDLVFHFARISTNK